MTLDEKRTMATDFSIVWSSSEDVAQYESYFSLPEFVEFPNVINGQHAYAYFYAPYNNFFQGSSDEKPPLLVRTHGKRIYYFCPFFFMSFMIMTSCYIRNNKQKHFVGFYVLSNQYVKPSPADYAKH